MIDKVHSPIGLNPLLPSVGQWAIRVVIWRGGYSRNGTIGSDSAVVGAAGSIALVWVEEPLVLHLQHL